MNARLAVIAGLVCVLLLAAVAEAQEAATYYQQGRKAYDDAYKLAREQKFEEAAAALLTVSNDFADHEVADDAVYQAAYALQRLKKYEEALAAYDRLLKAYPNSPLSPQAVYNKAGIHYSYLKDYKAAAPLYEQVAIAYPGYLSAETALYMAVASHRNAKDYPKVVRGVNLFATVMPNKGSRILLMLNYKVEALIALDRLAEAAEAVQEMAQVAPKAVLLGQRYVNLASYFTRKKDYAKAIELCEKAAAIEAYEGAGTALLTAAQYCLYLEPRDAERAIAFYRQYVDTYPKGERVHDTYWRMADLYRGVVKDRRQEIATLKEFLEKHPTSIVADRALYYLGNAYRDMKQWRFQRESYETLIKEHPDSDYADDAMYQLAELQRLHGNKALAKELYEKLVREKRGYSMADQAARYVTTQK